MLEELTKLREEVVRLIVTTQESAYQGEFFRDLLEVAFPLNDLIVRQESETYVQQYEMQEKSNLDLVLRLCAAVQKYDVDIEYADFVHARNLSPRFANGIELAEKYFINDDEGKLMAFGRTPLYNTFQHFKD